MSSPSGISTSTALLYGAAVLLAAGGDAVYFDYKRTHDAEFRKALKRDKKRHVKAVKQEEAAATASQRQRLRNVVQEAKEEGFPSGVEEREAYFMNEVAHGETLCQEGPERALDAALCFYKALKVYPQPKDLISIYDKTVPKHVLDLLAEMIAADGSIGIGGVGIATDEIPVGAHGVE